MLVKNKRKEVKAEQQQIRALTTGGSESLSFTDNPLFKLRLVASGSRGNPLAAEGPLPNTCAAPPLLYEPVLS